MNSETFPNSQAIESTDPKTTNKIELSFISVLFSFFNTIFRCSGFMLDNTNCTMFLMEKEKYTKTNASQITQQKIYTNIALKNSEKIFFLYFTIKEHGLRSFKN